MRTTAIILAGLLLAGSATAGEVYVVTDAKGNRVYTDRPDQLPAAKVDVRTSDTDPVAVQERYADEMKNYENSDAAMAKSSASKTESSKAAALTAEDKAKRCADSRKRYETLMSSYRIYQQGPDGQRQYLDSAEIDAARIDAKKVMDEFCGGQ